MTGTISDFGSLSDRVGNDRVAADPAEPAPTRAYQPTHAWLDEQTPVIVSDWRRSEAGWEGLTIRAVVSGAALEWITAARLRRR